MRSYNIRTKLSLIFTLGILLFGYGAFVAFATPPTSPYAPAETLDPACAPGDTNCTVKVLYDLYGENVVTGFSAPTATGDNSVAIGNGANATGEGAVSLGGENTGIGTGASTASGIASLATGSDGLASGFASAVFGWQNTAGNDMAVAFGEQTTASGQRSVTFGRQTQATGSNSAAFGNSSQATGDSSFSLGFDSTASGDFSFAQGNQTQAYSYTEAVFGAFQTVYTPDNASGFDVDDRLFVLGNGTSSLSRNNALTVIKDGTFILNDDDTTWSSGDETKFFFDPVNRAFRAGSVDGTEWEGVNVGDGSIALGFTNSGFSQAAPIASGDNSFAIGTGTTASGLASVVTGVANTASGDGSFAGGQLSSAVGDLSFAFGDGVTASGDRGVAFGVTSTASGDTAFAAGSIATASGDRSVALGNGAIASGIQAIALSNIGASATGNHSFAAGNSVASGGRSMAFGTNNEAASFMETVFGMYDTTYTPTSATSAAATDRLFNIGNGGEFGPDSDAFTILKNGLTGVGFDNFETTSLDQLLQVNGGIYAIAPGATSSDSALQIRDSADSSNLFEVNGDGSFGNGAIGTGTFTFAPNYFGSGANVLLVASTTGAANITTSSTSSAGFSAVTTSDTQNSAIVVYRGRGGDAALQDGDTLGGYYWNGNDGTGGVQGAVNTAAIQTWVDGAVSDNTVPLRMEFLTGSTNAGMAQRLVILPTGEVGIGSGSFTTGTSTGEALQVGNTGISGAVARFTNSTGFCTIDPTTTTLNCTSDETLKKDITNLPDALDIISMLRPVTYRWNPQDEDIKKTPGFIAQEVEQVIPELVSVDDSTGLRTLSTTSLIPYLTKAIQELNNKIDLIAAGASAGANTAELVVDRLRAHEICLDDLCIDRDSLEQILDATGASSVQDIQGQDDPSDDIPVDPETGEDTENQAPQGDPQGQTDPVPDEVPSSTESDPISSSDPA